MNDDKVVELRNQVGCSTDHLTELLREGARRLLHEAVNAELSEFLSAFEDKKDTSGRQEVVRNGYLPKREVLTGIGPVQVKVPKVRDRGGEGRKFTSSLLPPYLRKTKSIEELLPWLYLKGISTGNFGEALAGLVGENAKGLSRV